jgi:outer membrane autotransporter protein
MGYDASAAARVVREKDVFMQHFPALRLAAEIPPINGAVLTPSAEVRYLWQCFDAYAEHGSFVDLAVAERDLHAFEQRFQMGVRQAFDLGAGQSFSWYAHAGLVLYQRAGDRDVEVNLLGTTAGFNRTESGALAGAGRSLSLAPGLDLFAGGEVYLFEDLDVMTGSAGLKLRF